MDLLGLAGFERGLTRQVYEVRVGKLPMYLGDLLGLSGHCARVNQAGLGIAHGSTRQVSASRNLVG
jgi:hypothetical protein